MHIKPFLLALLIFFQIAAIGQWKSNRCNSYSVADTIVLDSFTVIPSSIKLEPIIPFKFDQATNSVITEGNLINGTINICYKILPYNIHTPFSHRELSDLDSSGVIFKEYSFEQKEELFSTPGIEKSGVISRGVSFGNNQDVFVNSNLNLQLQGDISQDVKLTATISDQNIPIQPEGNTQQIQEFDRIFMELEHSRWKLQAGDIWLKNDPENYFMKYNKRVQGGKFNVNIIEDSNYTSNTYVGASLARGKFYSQVIQPIEGVQGPYRLNGSNGEKFIIVIANSEKVFLDGKEIQRGFNNDYVIDYNTGEITFNNSIVITKFSRVRVDFEYTERNFTRSVINTGHQQKVGNMDFYYEFFSEKDHKRQPILTELTNEDYARLSLVGDSLSDAYITGVRFSDTAAQIMYKQLIIGSDTIYEYSTNPDSAKYFVTFSEVGNGKGDYVIDLTPINGRIYKYVGAGQGNYLPIKLLPVPNKREMMVLGSRWNKSKNTSFYSEISMSNKDINLVSDVNDSDNKGFGLRFGYNVDNKKINSNHSVNGNLEYQYTGESFKVLDRIREADFQRDWNENNMIAGEDNILFSSIGITSKNGDFVKIDNNFRNKADDVSGVQNNVNWSETVGFLNLSGNTFYMDNDRGEKISQWRKMKFNPSLNLGYIKPGYLFNMEKNKTTNNQDSVLSSLMNYEEHNFYVKNGDTSKYEMLINYQSRKDFKPIDGEMNWFDGLNSQKWNDRANTYSVNMKKAFSTSQNLALTGSYRDLETKITADSTGNENNMLSRIDWNSNYFKRHLLSELTYTVNTSRELKREFQYIPWDNYSTATHVWRDNNGDGVEDLDEFFPILNNETQNTYVKFLVPTNDYINAFTNSLNYRLNVKGPSGWKNKSGIKKVLSKLDNVSILSTERKSTNEDLNSRLNPFYNLLDTLDLSSSDVLSLRKSLRSTMFFNRTNPKYGIDITKTSSSTKQLITNGTDARLRNGWDLNNRVNISRFLSTLTSLKYYNTYNKSTYLKSRNYDINEFGGEEKFSFQPTNSLRFTTNYSYLLKSGISQLENADAEINKIGLEVKLNQLSKRTITANFNYINILYLGEQNTPMAYEIMEGLQKGDNYTWQINIQQRLSNGLNINLIYDGRKSGENKSIHTGRMQVSALF